MAVRKARGVVAVAILAVLGLAAGVALRLVAEATIGAPKAEDRYEPWQTTVVYAADGGVLARLFREDRQYVELERIPRELRLAVVAVEDAAFFRHGGVNLWATARALVRNILHGRIVEGGSTITQQYVRNRYLSAERTLTRKLQEIHLALALEQEFSKPEILEMYLNEIYLGAGAYGVEASARRYFGRPVEELDLPQAALLAGLPRAPEHYNPFRNPAAARARRNFVLARMQRLGYISRAEADRAADSELELTEADRHGDSAVHFVEYVRRQLVDRFGTEAVYTGGLEVHTTLDRPTQRAAEAAVTFALDSGYIPTLDGAGDRGNGGGGPELALVSLEAGSGAIRAMLGGRGNDAFNRAVQAVRQPGSAFKPFVYAGAIQAGHHPGTVVNDLPMATAHGEGWVVWPRNYDDTYRGLISYRTALNLSVNVAAVRVLHDLGIEGVARLARQLGFSTLTVRDGRSGHYALALGGLERGVSPLEMAAAYAVFADFGVWSEPYAITRVTDREGRLLYEVGDGAGAEASVRPAGTPRVGALDGEGVALESPAAAVQTGRRRVLSEAQAYLVADMLRTAVEQGTGWRAALDRPVAGKTGTTDHNTDGWFIGFADDLVTAVWIGEDRPAPMRYARVGEGWVRAERDPELALTGVHASWIWGRYMRQVVAPGETPAVAPGSAGRAELDRRRSADREWWVRPEGVSVAALDPVTGLRAGKHTPVGVSELLLDGALPVRKSTFWSAIETGWIDPLTGHRGNEDDGAVQRRYLEKCRTLLGPAEIRLGGPENVTTADGRVFRGVYRVGKFEPVQRIDGETGLPERGREPLFETLPPASEAPSVPPPALPRKAYSRTRSAPSSSACTKYTRALE